ncbi:hypothetical protein GCM10022197_35970 [Microlunatus spumicola]|uniref:Uncharacterized protein n=2 Tax=Microlunatus spumicola TaxID=81499 RepID=A0ABP6Y212_9ACTN
MTAQVDGVELAVTRLWARRPHVSVRGQELPKDAQGRYELRDRSGRVRRVEASFDWRQFGPRLRVGDTDVLLGRPLPAWVRVGYLVLLVVGVGLGGAFGGLLAVASAMGSASLLRRTDRAGSHVLLAALVPFAAVVLYVGLVTGLSPR